jgi:hypothetical protein
MQDMLVRNILEPFTPIELQIVQYSLEIVTKVYREVCGLKEPVCRKRDGEIRSDYRFPKRKDDENPECRQGKNTRKHLEETV